MYINQLEIYNFRAFSGKKIEQDENGNMIEKDIHYKFNFVNGLNCIAGHNGIGKSTILAMLGNCGELKKNVATHLNGSQFRGDYTEIIKGNPVYDPKGKVCTLHFSELPSNYSYSETYIESLEFRTTFQNNSIRYRLIPVKNQNRKTEAKLRWPVYYMGLSRLYPIGESSDVSDTIMPEDITNEIKDIYSKIIPSKYDYKTVSKVSIRETNKKQGVGVSTEKYSYEANSAGQDNIGQILLSVLSFKKLKEKLGNEYFGGLLLIDEIETHMHPKWQKKILGIIRRFFPNLQIILTTHSPFVVASIDGARIYTCVSRTGYSEVCDETERYAHMPVEEVLMSDAFGEVHPFNDEIAGLMHKRKKLIEEGRKDAAKEIEDKLYSMNSEYFSYLKF